MVSAVERAVCVLGVHRSGTSLVAGMLDLMGVDFGPEEHLLPPEPDNPLGFWENRSIVEINDELLALAGGGWRDPPVFPPAFQDRPGVEALRRRAAELVRRDFGASELWGWKDPRACLTLPFWRRIIPEMRYVVCIRNPLDVARSLERRDGIPVERAGDLWVAYTSAALEGAMGGDHLIVRYEDLLEDWRTWAGRLARFLDLDPSAWGSAVEEKMERFVQPGLQHHRTTLEEMVGHPDLPFAAKALFLLLHDADAGPRDPRLLGYLGGSGSSHARDRARRVRELREARAALAEREQELADLRATRTFRYTAPLRAAYARIRARLSGR